VNYEVVAAIADSFQLIWPEAILIAAACVLYLGGTFRTSRNLWGTFALVALALAALAMAIRPPITSLKAADLYAAPLVLDKLAFYTKVLALVSGAVLVIFSWNQAAEEWAAEFYGTLLVLIAGVGITGMANELVVLFLGLELISIPTYVLLYLARSDRPAQEAAVKYFLLSVFSSALLLFGFSYLYGLTGTTNVAALTAALAEASRAAAWNSPASPPALGLVAVVMVVAALGFRIAAVPFHFYAPDVYQGTTTGLAALLALMPKIAGFVALIRLLGLIHLDGFLSAPRETAAADGPVLGAQLPTLLWILAAVTMTLGNILALLQDNLKRLLAYSSVAHAGYMLIGLASAAVRHDATSAAASAGLDAILFYLVAYGAMTVGAFAVIGSLHTPQHPVETVDDLSGLSRSHPRTALLMALFLFSLIGIPMTAGFVGKWLVFWAALGIRNVSESSSIDQARLFRILALIAALNAAVGGWYYLRIIAVMYLREPARRLSEVISRPALAAAVLCAAVTLFFGVYPGPLEYVAHDAASPPNPQQPSPRANAPANPGADLQREVAD
jgi:NADH-quinone oxidoreductase subunit N